MHRFRDSHQQKREIELTFDDYNNMLINEYVEKLDKEILNISDIDEEYRSLVDVVESISSLIGTLEKKISKLQPKDFKIDNLMKNIREQISSLKSGE